MFFQGESVGPERVLQLAILSIDPRPRDSASRDGCRRLIQVTWKGNHLGVELETIRKTKDEG